jgi:hypothetical protein
MNDFDATVDAITTAVENIRESTKRPFQQISSAESGQPGGGRGRTSSRGGRGGSSRGGRGRGGRGRGTSGAAHSTDPWTEPISSRWYQQHEISRMSKEQRQEMRRMRSERHQLLNDPNRQASSTCLPCLLPCTTKLSPPTQCYHPTSTPSPSSCWRHQPSKPCSVWSS